MIYLHNHPLEDLSIWTLADMVKQAKNGAGCRDVLWGYLNKKSFDYLNSKDYGLYANTCYYMSRIQEKEKRNEAALTLLFLVVLCDLNGAGNNTPKNIILRYAKKNMPSIAPAIVTDVRRISQRLAMTDEQLQNKFVTQMDRTPIPLVVFSLQECAEILIAEVNKDTEKEEKIYCIANERITDIEDKWL